MFEINLPIQTPQMNCGEDKGSGYNFGQKWTYLGSGNKILFYKVFYFKGNLVELVLFSVHIYWVN